MRKIIVPISGGKDSTSCLVLALREADSEVIPVFHDTGWDHPTVYKYLHYLEEKFQIKIQKTKYDEAPTMPEIIRKYKRFPFRQGRFCTSEYKGTAFRRWLKEISGEFEIWLGIRENESVNRQQKYGKLLDETLYHPDEIFPGAYPKYLSSRIKFRFPILYWTSANCFIFLEENGLKRNPLYDQGFARVGCFPCMLAGKAEQEKVRRTEFGRKQFAIIRELEKEIGQEYPIPSSDEEGGCMMCEI